MHPVWGGKLQPRPLGIDTAMAAPLDWFVDTLKWRAMSPTTWLGACLVLAAPHALLAQNAYIPNSGSSNLSVISTPSNTVIATVSLGSAPYDVAVTPDGSKVYVTHFGSNAVSVIST